MWLRTVTVVVSAVALLTVVAVWWLEHELDGLLASTSTATGGAATASSGSPVPTKTARAAVRDPAANATPPARVVERAATGASPPDAPTTQLNFQAPATVRRGDAVDFVVRIDTRRAITHAAFTISYDPAILHLRGLEEIDYTNNSVSRGRFEVEEAGKASVIASLVMRRGQAPIAGSLSVGILQFEAIASGWVPISVLKISLSDGRGPVPYTVLSRESMVAVD